MPRYLLDTNILSHITKPIPSAALQDWLSDQEDQDLYIASLTLAELRRSILDKPSSRKRTLLEAWFVSPDGPPALFAGRILPFDQKAALIWAKLMSEGSSKSQPRSALDTIIAATAIVNDCVLVTENERDLPGINLLDPMRF